MGEHYSCNKKKKSWLVGGEHYSCKKNVVGWLRESTINFIGGRGYYAMGTMPANGPFFVCGRKHNVCEETNNCWLETALHLQKNTNFVGWGKHHLCKEA